MVDRPRSRRIIYGGKLPGVIYVGPKKSKTQELLDRMDRAWTRGAEEILSDIQRENRESKEKKKSVAPASSTDDSIEISKIKIDASGKFSSGGGDIIDRAFSKIRASFGLAAASRKAFKESGGNPRSLRRMYFLSKALGAEFGGDFRRRTRGTFSRNPDATQDPGMSKEERFAEVVKRDLANRPQMMKQGEIFDVDKYTDKTALQSITDLAKKTADKILGLEPGFVRIEKSQTETSKAFVKITQNLTEVKNTFVKTADNFKEFVDNKEEVIKIKTKIREVLRKEQDENKRSAVEQQLEMLNDVAGTTDVEETDQGLDEEQEQQQEDGGGGGFDLPDFRRPRIRGRLRLLRRRFGRFGRGISRRLGGLGRGLGRIGRGISGFGRRLGGVGRFIGGRVIGPVIGDMLFPEGAGVSEPQMGPDGKFRTPDGKLVPEPGAPKPKSVASRVGNVAESGKGLINKGKGAIGKVAGKVGSKLGGGLAKSIAKKIPGVGLVIGGLAAADRFSNGDIIGGIGELGSGIASLVPGVGTAISFGIDALLMGKDVAAEASKPEAPTKLSSGGIVAGEAGHEAVIPLTTSIGKKVVSGIKDDMASGGMGAIGSVAPMLSAMAGIVRNPLYGSILGPVVNPILKPLISEYKIPVFSGELGMVKTSKLQSASTQAKGKSDSMEKSGDKEGGFFGNLFKGIGGVFKGIGDFFGRLFGKKKKNNNGGDVKPVNVPSGKDAKIKAAFAFYKSKGFSDVGAAYMVGNLLQESQLDPAARGDGGKAHGLAQWREDQAAGARWLKYLDWARANNKQPGDFYAQLEYTIVEGQQYNAGLTTMKGNDKAAIKSYIKAYEGYSEEGNRFGFAEDILKNLNKYKGNSPSSSPRGTPAVTPAPGELPEAGGSARPAPDPSGMNGGRGSRASAAPFTGSTGSNTPSVASKPSAPVSPVAMSPELRDDTPFRSVGGGSSTVALASSNATQTQYVFVGGSKNDGITPREIQRLMLNA